MKKITLTLPSTPDTCDRITNLRPTADTASLIPVGMPHILTGGDYTPLVSFCHDDTHRTLFLYSADMLYTLDTDTPLFLCRLPSAPLCAVTTPVGIIVMTSQGAYRIDYDTENNTWIALGLTPQFPAFSFTVTDTAAFSARIDARLLTQHYGTHSSQLSSADLHNFSADLISAYDSACAQASHAGYFLQPVIARYRLVDRDGNTLFASTPVIVALPDGLQAVNADTLAIDSYTAIESHALTLTGFRIGITVPPVADTAWNDIVTAMEIELSPMIDPIDRTTLVSHRLENLTATGCTLRYFMPGVATSMSVDADKFSAMVVDYLQRWGEIASVKARISSPMSLNAGETIAIDCNADSPIPDMPVNSPMQQAFTAFPRFVAETALNSGDMVAWADISSSRQSPCSLDMLALQRTPGAWRAYARVDCDDGDILVCHTDGTALSPADLSPLIIYPDASASSVTLTLSADGVVNTATFPLSPAPSGQFACYIAPMLAPVRLTDEAEAYIIPAHKASSRRQPGMMAVAQYSRPLSLTASVTVSQAPIVAVTPAVRSTSSWDFARKHLYAFTASGTYAVAVNALRTSMSAHVIDSRPVLSSQAIASTPDGVIVATASALIRVYASRAVDLISGVNFDKVAFSPRFNELWLTDKQNRLVILSFSRNGGFYWRDFASPRFMTTLGDYLFVVADGTLYNASVEDTSQEIYVSFDRRLAVDGDLFPHALHRHRLPVVRNASWRVFASRFDGFMAVYGDSGTAHPGRDRYILNKMIVSGSLNAPLSTRIIAPQCPYVAVVVDGVVSPDFILNDITLNFIDC